MLVVTVGGRTTAIVLDGAEPFVAFDCEDSSGWFGIFIPDVVLEIDFENCVEFDSYNAPLGMLVRTMGQLSIAGRSDDRLQDYFNVPLMDGFTGDASGRAVGFSNWRIVIGSGIDKIILKSFEIR